ncbi:cysteine methyltransferase [Psychromonas sp. MB-3u-54]|uniref:methylated-DNA--[protein]-cysteine S-methyltransferase n=1 Tax=Psychromonas sp. MB-3u-54 TaxID=2058319 RepID=UPI000C34D072|nr:methylated-DNA--[protein]-cysteine S-methyltransferase [Psychromonas sp. MB-3u-54]PKH03212.1 cysteine methyltransferase [Psychromonas sp. MB-3u-54]
MNHYCYYKSPTGTLTLQASTQGLLGVWFETQQTQPENLGLLNKQQPILTRTVAQLDEYFRGDRKYFTLPTAATGTVFQQQVWSALATIPFGKTWCYQELANAIGNPNAVRAVGLANSKNPISIIIPCHRVIGKNGKLTGYAGGVERKQALLKHEGVILS